MANPNYGRQDVMHPADGLKSEDNKELKPNPDNEWYVISTCALTDESMAALRTAGVPESVLTKLNAVKGIEFSSKDTLAVEIAKHISKDEADRYLSLAVIVSTVPPTTVTVPPEM